MTNFLSSFATNNSHYHLLILLVIMSICQNTKLQKVNFILQNRINQDAKNTIYSWQSLPASAQWMGIIFAQYYSEYLGIEGRIQIYTQFILYF